MRDDAQPVLACVNGHAFDFARQGYVNLLLSHQKHSQEPGYDAETLRARKAMLERGLFDPLATLLVDLVGKLEPLPGGDAGLTTLDAGTGEGFIFAKIIDALLASGRRPICAVGTDISRPAIQIATQYDAPVMWCVANLMKRLPFADAAFDLLMNILAPANPQEYRRILKPGGYLIKVLPLAHHLAEIREAVYENARTTPCSDEHATAELAEQFTLLASHELCYQREVGQAFTKNLLRMSPLFWKAKKDKLAQVQQQGLPEITLHFSVTVWRNSAKSGAE